MVRKEYTRAPRVQAFSLAGNVPERFTREMNPHRLFFALVFLSISTVSAQEEYPVLPDSKVQDGVPQGELVKGKFTKSSVFPGTERDYAVYIPSQYDGSEPAALMVFQDGMGYLRDKSPGQIQNVFNNLIHKGEMPVTIGVFVNPGVVPATSEKALPRFNRSFEYDAFDDRYAEFVIDELLPFLSETHDLKLTDDPNLRGISGASSGAIAAFTVAWHRPDSFRRVYSQIGTFVGLRGGNEFPVLVRKTAPKPLRIFLQDGSNDLDIYCGDWFVANQDMLSSFRWSGYEVNHQWGEGGHSRSHGGAIMSDALRWLWEGWKENPEITTHYENRGDRATEFLIEDEGWEVVSEGHGFTEGPAVTRDGTLYFSDLEESKIWKVDPESGEVSLFKENTGKTNGLAFAPNGKLYGCQGVPGRIVAWDLETGEQTVITENVKPNDIVVGHFGAVYFSEPRKKTIWVIPPGVAGANQAIVAAEGYSGVNGVTLSPDQSLVYAADYSGRYVWSGQRNEDHTIAYNQPYFHLHTPPAALDVRSHADGMAVSEDGWVLVATAIGVQICDQPGRVNLIVPMPPGERHPSNVAFGGEDGKTLYATAGGKVFKRKVNLVGAQAWKGPNKPEKPRL